MGWRLTHGPVPVRLMLYGLLGSSPTLTAMLALSADPPPVGVKVTAIVQLDSGVAVAPHVPPVTAKSPAFAPLKLSLTDNAVFDRLVTVTFSVLDEVDSVPYASVTGVTVAGIVCPVLSATVYGLSGSGLSAIDSVPDSVPKALAVKVTSSVHAVPAARVAVQVPPLIEKSGAFVPLKFSLNVTVWV